MTTNKERQAELRAKSAARKAAAAPAPTTPEPTPTPAPATNYDMSGVAEYLDQAGGVAPIPGMEGAYAEPTTPVPEPTPEPTPTPAPAPTPPVEAVTPTEPLTAEEVIEAIDLSGMAPIAGMEGVTESGVVTVEPVEPTPEKVEHSVVKVLPDDYKPPPAPLVPSIIPKTKPEPILANFSGIVLKNDITWGKDAGGAWHALYDPSDPEGSIFTERPTTPDEFRVVGVVDESARTKAPLVSAAPDAAKIEEHNTQRALAGLQETSQGYTNYIKEHNAKVLAHETMWSGKIEDDSFTGTAEEFELYHSEAEGLNAEQGKLDALYQELLAEQVKVESEHFVKLSTDEKVPKSAFMGLSAAEQDKLMALGTIGFKNWQQSDLARNYVALPDGKLIDRTEFDTYTPEMKRIALTDGIDALSTEGLSGEAILEKYKQWGIVADAEAQFAGLDEEGNITYAHPVAAELEATRVQAYLAEHGTMPEKGTEGFGEGYYSSSKEFGGFFPGVYRTVELPDGTYVYTKNVQPVRESAEGTLEAARWQDTVLETADLLVPGLWLRNVSEMSAGEIAANALIDLLIVAPMARAAARVVGKVAKRAVPVVTKSTKVGSGVLLSGESTALQNTLRGLEKTGVAPRVADLESAVVKAQSKLFKALEKVDDVNVRSAELKGTDALAVAKTEERVATNQLRAAGKELAEEVSKPGTGMFWDSPLTKKQFVEHFGDELVEHAQEAYKSVTASTPTPRGLKVLEKDIVRLEKRVDKVSKAPKSVTRAQKELAEINVKITKATDPATIQRLRGQATKAKAKANPPSEVTRRKAVTQLNKELAGKRAATVESRIKRSYQEYRNLKANEEWLRSGAPAEEWMHAKYKYHAQADLPKLQRKVKAAAQKLDDARNELRVEHTGGELRKMIDDIDAKGGRPAQGGRVATKPKTAPKSTTRFRWDVPKQIHVRAAPAAAASLLGVAGAAPLKGVSLAGPEATQVLFTLPGAVATDAEYSTTVAATVPVHAMAPTPIHEVAAGTDVKTAVEINEEYQAQLAGGIEDAVSVFNRVYGETGSAEQAADKTVDKVFPHIVTSTALQTEPKTAEKIATRTALRTALRTMLADDGFRARHFPILPPILPPGATSPKRRFTSVPPGSATWAQGIFWKYIPPPYNIDKPITLPKGVVPEGAKNADSRKPSETIQIIGDPGMTVPERISVDKGVVDIFIRDGGASIEFAGRGQKTNVGRRIDSTTKGMSVPSVESAGAASAEVAPEPLSPRTGASDRATRPVEPSEPTKPPAGRTMRDKADESVASGSYFDENADWLATPLDHLDKPWAPDPLSGKKPKAQRPRGAAVKRKTQRTDRAANALGGIRG